MTVEREIGKAAIAAGEARTVVIRRRYDAEVEDVWSACTEPDRLNRWYLQVSGDLREGGRFALEGNASGEILRCDAPRLLRVTWAYGDRPVDEVELRLSPDGEATLLELVHATTSRVVDWQGEPMDVVPGIGSGWELSLPYLERYLRGELPDAPGKEWFEFTPELLEQDRANAAAWEALSPMLVVSQVVPAPPERVMAEWSEPPRGATRVDFAPVEGGTRVTVTDDAVPQATRDQAKLEWEARLRALAERLR